MTGGLNWLLFHPVESYDEGGVGGRAGGWGVGLCFAKFGTKTKNGIPLSFSFRLE
jgi:hypothetical protein